MLATSTPATRPRRQRPWLPILLVTPGLLALAGMFGTVALVRYVATPRLLVNGEAMSPCFGDGARLTASRLSERDCLTLRHGDIIVFDPPVTTTKHGIKRIVAIGGDQIAIRDGQLFLHGAAHTEAYITQPALYRFPPGGTGEPYTIPAGKIFVLGDNRTTTPTRTPTDRCRSIASPTK